jgi:hypothetical protein
MKNLNIRNQRGVSGLLLVVGTACMILMPLVFLGYEFLRYTTVQQELQSVCEAAALAGAVGIATNGGSTANNIWTLDAQAMNGAYLCFCENSVTDCQFNSVDAPNPNVNSDAAITNVYVQGQYFNNSAPWSNVAVHTAKVNFILLDNAGNQTNWSAAAGYTQSPLTPAARLQVVAYYGYSLPILGGIGIGPFTMTASATGGLPQLDIVLCFDVSGSMDDFTNVSFVNRYWVNWNGVGKAGSTMSATDADNIAAYAGAGLDHTNWTGGCIEYDVCQSAGGMTYSSNSPYWTQAPDSSSSGPLYYVAGCAGSASSFNGTAVNVQPPMNLNQAIEFPNKLWFSAAQRSTQIAGPPYPSSELGMPPGNYPAGTNYVANQTSSSPDKNNHAVPTFTDLIVNLPTVSGNTYGDAHWYPGTPGYAGVKQFNDIAWAVEGARGNLESSTNLASAVNPDAAANPTNAPGQPMGNGSGYILGYPGRSNTYGSFQGSGSGYFSAYWGTVRGTITEPLSTAISAASNFFQLLDGSADCHFGLICFSDGIGSSSTDTWADGWQGTTAGPSTTAPGPPAGHINGWTTAAVQTTNSPPWSANIAGNYTATGLGSTPTAPDPNANDGDFPLPLLMLNNGQQYSTSASYDNYTTGSNPVTVGQVMTTGDSNGVLPLGGTPTERAIVALGSTDITDAFGEAIRELNPSTKFARPKAHPAIVIFTDGIPDLDFTATPGTDATTAYTECTTDLQALGNTANGLGIPVFSIGLALGDSNMTTKQSNLLNAIQSAAGGSSPPPETVTNISNIDKAFQTTIKNLVVLTQ